MAKKLTEDEFIALATNVHSGKYDYSKTIYVNNRCNVTITCKLHGDFQLKANKHTSAKRGCPRCTRLKTNEQFISESRSVHGDTYIYNDLNYITWKEKVTLTCKVHGNFDIKPHRHIRDKMGCPQCREGNQGWSDTNWVLKGLTSKNFDAYKVYVILCYNESERFIKIGKTFLPMTKRFHNKATMPYKYDVKYIIESDDGKAICELERQLQQVVGMHSYNPLISFHGSIRECFDVRGLDELDVSWLHIDTRSSDTVRLFKA